MVLATGRLYLFERGGIVPTRLVLRARGRRLVTLGRGAHVRGLCPSGASQPGDSRDPSSTRCGAVGAGTRIRSELPRGELRSATVLACS